MTAGYFLFSTGFGKGMTDSRMRAAGLDPASRRTLWECIVEAKKRRAVLLTTHSMEEAEGLCDRIGKMAAATGSATASVRWRMHGDVHAAGPMRPHR